MHNRSSDRSLHPRAGGPVSFPTRVLDWIDDRTGARDLTRKILHEPIPGGARMAYVFGSGLLAIFLLQVVTGLSLALYYTPTAETAHTSVAYITKQVAGGAFLRSLHSYGSSAMIIVLALHFFQTFFYGSFKGRRELLWLSGATLSFLVLGMGFTGYLLPWDQKAYFATAVGTNVAGQVPLIGELITRFLRGGTTIGTITLSRFYVAHVFLLPATIFAFIGAHIFLFRKAGPAGPVHEHPIEPELPTESFYPRQVLYDLAAVLVFVAAIAALSYLRPVTLGPIANPSDATFLPRPEWYYLPMFEWLKFWEGPTVVIGIVVIPGLLATAFFLMPFLDRRLERRPWRRPIPALAVSIVVLGMVYFGARSHMDDSRDPVSSQLARQQADEAAYNAAAFEPYSPERSAPSLARSSAVVADPRIAHGKSIFLHNGCVGCHGIKGNGSGMGPALIGVTKKFSAEQIAALLHTPNARMKAAGMPALNEPQPEIEALIAYLGALGTPAASVAPQAAPASEQPAPQPKVTAVPVRLVRFSRDVRAENRLQPAGVAQAGKQVYKERGCLACHGREGAGGRAPALAPLIAHLTDPKLRQLLVKPNDRMKEGGMEGVADAAPQDVADLVAYLRSLPVPMAQAQPAPPRPASTQNQPQ
jgi:ubiquinol-cytochrome c reductase cytochrome b subunit